MTARLPAAVAESADVPAPLRELVVEVRGLRADLRRSANYHRGGNSNLLAAIGDEFGPGRFTSSGLLTIAADEPGGALAVALAEVIDLGASPRSRSTSLGALLAHMSGVEVVSRKHGVAIFSLCTSA